MDDRHLSVELLKAIHRGDRSPGDLATVAMAHLFETCPQCRETFEAWRRELGEEVADPFLSRYDKAFDQVRAKLRGDNLEVDVTEPWEQQVEEEKRRAEELVEELATRSLSERRHLVEKDPGRYSGPALASLLLDHAWESLPGKPAESYTWAALSRAVLQHSNATPYAVELYARSLALQANALRAQGELRSADELMGVARFLLRSQGGGEVLTRAELDRFEGSLRRAQRRFDEAKSLFSRAVMAFAMEGERVEAAKTLIALGSVFRELGDLDRAVEVAAQALEVAHEEELPDLELFARHNLAYALNQSGVHEEARQIFEETFELYEKHGDPPIHLRRLWLDGHISRAEGDLSRAESSYVAVREGFLRIGVGYHAALASLDLATLYAEQGRTADLKALAEEIVPIFEAQDVHREATAALMLFQDAVKAEQVTLRYLLELIRYLEHARLDPSLAFQQPA